MLLSSGGVEDRLASKLQRLQNLLHTDTIAATKVAYGLSDLDYLKHGACAKETFSHCFLQDPRRLAAQSAGAADLRARQIPIAPHSHNARRLKTPHLPFPRLNDASTHLLGGRPGTHLSRRPDIPRSEPFHGTKHVDPVQQRPRQTAVVARHLLWTANAPVRLIAKKTTAASVRIIPLIRISFGRKLCRRGF